MVCAFMSFIVPVSLSVSFRLFAYACGGCSGGFEKHGAWYNADKSKMLVAEYTADGKTKKWREQQNNLKYAAFQVRFLFLFSSSPSFLSLRVCGCLRV